MTERPPSWFVRRLREISPDLGVQWLVLERKWAIHQKLYNTPSVEVLTGNVARAVQREWLKRGYVMDLGTLALSLYPQVARTTLVMRVQEPDGAYRPLDERTLRALRIMAWKLRHRDVDDWIKAGDEMAYEDERSRNREIDGISESIKRDDVFHRILGDTIAGLKIHHSVHGRPGRQQGAIP